MQFLHLLIALAAIQLAQADSHGGDQNHNDDEGMICSTPSTQAAFNNKAFSYDANTDPATFISDTSAGQGHGISADSVMKAGLAPGKELNVNGYNYTLANWGKGENDNWIERGQKVRVKPVPGADHLGFLLASDMGSFGGEFNIVYTDCSKQSTKVGASDWKSTEKMASGNNVAVSGLSTTDGGEARLYSADVPIDETKEIAYVEFPKRVYNIRPDVVGSQGHIHVFALATQKIED